MVLGDFSGRFRSFSVKWCQFRIKGFIVILRDQWNEIFYFIFWRFQKVEILILKVNVVLCFWFGLGEIGFNYIQLILVFVIFCIGMVIGRVVFGYLVYVFKCVKFRKVWKGVFIFLFYLILYVIGYTRVNGIVFEVI